MARAKKKAEEAPPYQEPPGLLPQGRNEAISWLQRAEVACYRPKDAPVYESEVAAPVFEGETEALCDKCGMAGGWALHDRFVCLNDECECSPRLIDLGESWALPLPPEVNDALWHRWILFHQLDPAQQELYLAWYDLPPTVRIVVAMISRRFGKTTVYGSIAIEIAGQKAHSLQHYAAMTTNQVRDMLVPVFQQILETCPEDIKPTPRIRDGLWVFGHNDALIKMGGAEDQQKCNRFRGAPSDAFWIDEAGYIEQLDYLVRSIALPMTHGRGPLARITLYSNAPYSPSHAIVGFVNSAKDNGAYEHRDVYASPRYSEAEIEQYAKDAGGRESAEWIREYLAQIVVDEDHAVIPEWSSRETGLWVIDQDSFRARAPGPDDAESDIKQPLIREVPQPQYLDVYVSMDLGFAPDLTSILTGYWDYLNAWLVVIGERELSKATTDIIATEAKELEQEHWSEYWDFIEHHHGRPRRPFMRVMDVDKQMQADLAALHGMQFIDAQNKDLDSQINRLRQGVRHGKVIIHPRCKKLISHVRGAYWDTKRKSFARPNKKPRAGEAYYGHFDHLSALQLMYTHINRTHDPYPAIPVGVTPDSHHISGKALRRRAKQDGLTMLAQKMKARRARRFMRRTG